MKSKILRVLFLQSHLKIGGAQQHVFDLITGMDTKIFMPIVCCIRERGLYAEQLYNRGVRVYSDLLKFEYDIRIIWKLSKIMKFEKIDLIYNSGTNKTFLIGYLASLISGTRKTIVAIHSTNAPKKKKVTTPISRWIIRRVQRVVMVANAQKRIVCQRENINHNNVTVIHNGIPVKRLISADYYDYKQINVFADNPKVVGIVARLDDEKNHITFLDVAKIVCKEIEMAYFVIVGDGPERQYLEYYCHKLALNDNVRFVGSQNEIGRILPLFNVGVLTSYNETFPLSILEMMGVGIPVVVTDVGGLREMISNGEEGFIVPTHKPQLIADKIIELLRDKNKSKVMGQKGRTRVLSDFTVERMAEKYQQLFREIIEL